MENNNNILYIDHNSAVNQFKFPVTSQYFSLIFIMIKEIQLEILFFNSQLDFIEQAIIYLFHVLIINRIEYQLSQL